MSAPNLLFWSFTEAIAMIQSRFSFLHAVFYSMAAFCLLLLLPLSPAHAAQSGFDQVPLPLTIAKPELALKGMLQQGSLIVGKTLKDSKVSLNDKPVAVTGQGVFVIGFNRDAKPEQRLEIVKPDGTKITETLVIAAREYDIQYIEGISKSIMQPNQESLKRIRKENAMIRKARESSSQHTGFLEKFIWPTQGPITGVYGSQRYYNGEPRRPHFGLDIAAPMGTEVIAPASGTIVLTHPDMFFSGGTIILDHGYGITSTFIHLNEVLVEEGQQVAQGDLLGKVGQSGRATGPHLDWRINWFATRLDPAFLIGLNK